LSVLSHLLLSSAAFGGESERAALASVLDAQLPRGDIEWLEVGVGSGANLIYLLRALERERRFHVLAIDPQSSPAAETFAEWPVSFHRTKLEDLELAGPYDCINIRQSCHYLDHPLDSIVRLAHALSAGGIMAVTLWAPDCALLGLHQRIAAALGSAERGLMADGILEHLPGKKFQVLSRGQVRMALDIDLIRREATVAAALVGLAARKLDIAGISEDDRAKLARRFFADKDRFSRVNEIVLVGRMPSSDPL
jgi:SAM-dependent methyltransferase